ncbi:MAG: hypothetical protein NTY48_05895 [Candidatus Diapherotrites archaeon]|nr:hypothetical protein [Candidatus Diapherotrites archaeon]
MKNGNITIQALCRELLEAYKKGELGQTTMPEESHPKFEDMDNELRLAYFTLPMALNYQRNSYKLWEAALKTYEDKETNWVFDAKRVNFKSITQLQKALLKHKLALQPNKHPQTWHAICHTIEKSFGTFEELIRSSKMDFLKLRELVQHKHKKGFLYLSGPKIFNYWTFIIQKYSGIKLANSEFIEIAPDTHVTRCSVKLGVITAAKAKNISKEKLSEKWRKSLDGSQITPIEIHSPPWFWSRNGFIYKLKNKD